MSRMSLIATWTLGISLFVTSPLWAADYRIVNKANGPIQVHCATGNTTHTVSHGIGADYQCTGTFSVQRTDDHPQYTIADDCQSGSIKQTTVTILTMDDAEYLARAEECVPHTVRLPSS